MRPIGGAQRRMPGRTGLDLAALIVDAELVTVDIAEVDFHPGKFVAKPLQEPIHFASHKLHDTRIYRNVFVAIDLNPHVFLCSPAFTGAGKDFLEFGFEAGSDDSIWRVKSGPQSSLGNVCAMRHHAFGFAGGQ
jgi:hypothetical protein